MPERTVAHVGETVSGWPFARRALPGYRRRSVTNLSLRLGIQYKSPEKQYYNLVANRNEQCKSCSACVYHGDGGMLRRRDGEAQPRNKPEYMHDNEELR